MDHEMEVDSDFGVNPLAFSFLNVDVIVNLNPVNLNPH